MRVRVVRRRLDGRALPRRGGLAPSVATMPRTIAERVLVVVGQVVGDAADARVQVAAAEVLRA